MNKLDVALKLLRLLNERKTLDSRIVADELNVSLRTAQRYLLDLSGLPCVIADEKEHTYGLASDYSVKDALLTVYRSEIPPAFQGGGDVDKAICGICRTGRHGFPEIPCFSRDGIPRDNRQKINQLVSLIRRKLKEKMRGLP
ncbi:MAG TPA: hypothetical protein VI298_03165 [Geobacteraceae bacterium]